MSATPDLAFTALTRSPHAVEVVEAALQLHALSQGVLPTGGGLALAGAARGYAEAVVAALELRDMLPRQLSFL